jgi:hypothetical protein
MRGRSAETCGRSRAKARPPAPVAALRMRQIVFADPGLPIRIAIGFSYHTSVHGMRRAPSRVSLRLAGLSPLVTARILPPEQSTCPVMFHAGEPRSINAPS